MPLACADTRRHVTAPQTPDLTQRDALARFAPDRAARRALWHPYSRAARPDLLPWDLGLDWSVPAPERGEVLGEALCTQHLTRVDLRFTVAPTRAQALSLMAQLGLTVAPWARTADVPADWDEVVVYLSEYGGHVGQDKVRLPAAQARREHPGRLCTRFLPPDLPPGAPEGVTGASERDLVAGDHVLHLRLLSRDWRSNVAVTDAHWSAVTARPDTGPYGREHDALLGPLFAIDFVISGGVRWAVDFNTSPGATGAPVHELPGRSITGAVQGWRGWTG
ncbi:hypothetical protein [Deinococcus radiotolerans]|uniref:ATP-grasp domain-containing protein n=1 Tax=Deinococcus radiotolerans TaxID=1309407 RepID=A0ABQ2FIC6_9DEIO|nr:hypothetical protein [Deinococcus radiotolerans]GGK92296.1 hypothetical protein GCM10010844_08520 [Deinococcus radiotolerans]